MRHTTQRILIADDEQYILRTLRTILRDDSYDIITVASGRGALDELLTGNYAVLLVDLTLPDLNGIELLTIIKKKGILTETIIFTGRASVSTAVEAIKKGAYDYLTKPIEPNRLNTIVLKAVEHYNLVLSHKKLERQIQTLTRYDSIIGQSNEMLDIYKLIDVVAETTANVVITGESGTGKELVARAIHRKGNRSQGPFIAVNCSAFPKEILENELFGHEEGAFTGALKQKAGCFELADKGTLFLDEICEMPMETQAKILRALEERCFRRLGGKEEIAVDVRVISASNMKLEKAVEEKRLREDIYYRLSVVEIELPPLRERTGDLGLLADEFLQLFNEKNNKQVRAFSPETVDMFHRYPWPGNVRELKNTIERAVVLCESDIVQVKHLPNRIVNPNGKRFEVQIPLGIKLEDAERELIFRTLEFTNNNKTRAAQVLGISLKTLHNKLNLYRAKNLYT
ncbi:MAG: sigma-54-dependent transcriptional regulator [bacterium]